MQTSTHPPVTIELFSPLGLITAAILFLALALGLIVPKVAGISLILLGLISIIWLTVHRGWTLGDMHASERVLVIAATAYVLVIMLGWIWHRLDPAAGQGLGRHARLLLILPLF